jgi:2-phospho-L-lactate transferase/gluconeogenesis factor (CofD/UPF0052 family)
MVYQLCYGLKTYRNLTAIVTVADDGGHPGGCAKLRHPHQAISVTVWRFQ